MEALTKVGEQVLKSNKDADTLVVQTAVTQTNGGNKSVQVLANDSDILFLLVYHGHQFQNLRFGDVLIHQVWDVMTEAQRQWFLLAYAYSGCDTVSHIFGKGKVAIMKMFTDPKNGEILAPILEAFMNPDTPLEVIDREGVRLMQLIYGDISKSLGELRYIAYRKQIANGKVTPERIPTSEGAGKQHSRRTFSTLREWILLKVNLQPHGWELRDDGFYPVYSTDPVAPIELFKLIYCNCKGNCLTNMCNCFKNNVKCMPGICGSCDDPLSCDNLELCETSSIDFG